MTEAEKIGQLEKSVSQLQQENERLRAQLETDVELLTRDEQQLKLVFLSAVQALVRAIELKDPYTVGHSELVSKYSVACAKKIGLDEDVVERIRIAGILIDVGKIGVSREILLKPGPLTPAERQILQVHSQYGAEILEPIMHPLDVSGIIYQHHERFDGSGYPDGISDDQIMIEARILGLVDSFVAMKTKRSWREPLEVADIREYFKEQAGKKFDPLVVDSFLKVLDAGADALEEELDKLAKSSPSE